MKTLLLIGFLLVNLLAYAETDTLVYVSELEFITEKEKQAFHDVLQNDNQSLMRLFYYTANSDENAEAALFLRELSIHIDNFKSAKIKRKSETKKIKYIYENLHESFLTKYKESCFFYQISEDGTYNCVTASIMYGLVLSELEIPITIKLSENHAFLMAYPETHSIVVETTNPQDGYMVYDINFKTDYVKYLRNSKVISENEYITSSINELFDKHYFKEENINLTELAGVQYLNLGILFLNKHEYKQAFKQFEKAWILFPSDRATYLMLNSAIAIISKLEFNSIEEAKYLEKLSRYTNYGISNENIVNEFVNITQKQLFSNSKTELYDSVYNYLFNNIKDEGLKKEISFIYNYERSRFLYNKAEYTQALKFAEQSYKINPANADAQTILVYCVSNKLAGISDPFQGVDLIHYYTENTPKITKNNAFNQLQVNAYLLAMAQAYEQSKPLEAKKYQGLFEENFLKEADYTILKNSIAYAYSKGAVFFFKKGRYSDAKKIIKHGLEFSPQNPELVNRLKALE